MNIGICKRNSLVYALTGLPLVALMVTGSMEEMSFLITFVKNSVSISDIKYLAVLSAIRGEIKCLRRKIKMSIFTRFKDIVNSNINSLLDKAEDPEKMLRLMIGEMEDTVIDLKTTTAARMAEAIRSEKKVDEAKATVDRWQARAELAIEKGKDDLAREALMEKKHAQETYERALENINSLKKSIEEGKEEIRTLEYKIKAAKAKLTTLQREQERAQERRDSSVNLNARFEEMENRINRMNAYNDLSKKSEEKSAEAKFSEMEKNEEIEAEIERIKKEKGIEK